MRKRAHDRSSFDREVAAYRALTGLDEVPRVLRTSPGSLIIELAHRGTPLVAISPACYPPVEAVVGALAAVHGRGLAHGNLHAGNVLVCTVPI